MEEMRDMQMNGAKELSPVLSVIVPVYNAEKYLNDCIESILNQTLTNLELILVDDGSMDGSYLICKKYAQEDKRIIVFHKENEGTASARNMGLRMAKGAYVAYVDADDWIDSNMYKSMLEKMKNENADIAICGYVEEYGDHTILKKNRLETDVYRGERMDEIFSKALYTGEYGLMGIVPSLWNKIFRREDLLRNQLKVCSDIYMGEDGIVTYTTLLDAACVVISNEEYFYHYRIHSESKEHSFNLQIFDDAFVFYDELQRIFKKKNNNLMQSGLNYFICSRVFWDIECLLARSNQIDLKIQYNILKGISQNRVFQSIESNIELSKLPIDVRKKIKLLRKGAIIRMLFYVYSKKIIKKIMSKEKA